jgi:hypothetical protein
MHLVFYSGSKKKCEEVFSGMSLAEEMIGDCRDVYTSPM